MGLTMAKGSNRMVKWAGHHFAQTKLGKKFSDGEEHYRSSPQQQTSNLNFEQVIGNSGQEVD